MYSQAYLGVLECTHGYTHVHTYTHARTRTHTYIHTHVHARTPERMYRMYTSVMQKVCHSEMGTLYINLNSSVACKIVLDI